MRSSAKIRLCAGTALFVMAIALNATPALAACATDGTTVTCSGTVPASTVNSALAAVPAPSVTLRVDSSAVVTQDAFSIQPSGAFVGTVDIGNAGLVGTAAAPVGLTYFGSPSVTSNQFLLNNSGTITGQVLASNVGGPITAVNTGTLSGGLSLFGSGAIALTSSGPIYISTAGGGATAVQLQSFQFNSANTGTAGVDGVTTTTQTGGAVTASITGPVAVPAVGAGATISQGINLYGVGGASLALNSVAGAVLVQTTATNSTATTGGFNTSTVGGTTTTSSANTSTAVGGLASATLGSNANVASLSLFSGPSGATATIAGTVGSATSSGNVFASSFNSNTASSNTTVNDGTTFTSTSVNSSNPVGGAASVDVAATGQVFGSASSSSNAGQALVAVEGKVGNGSGSTITTFGSVSATSSGQKVLTNSTFANNAVTGDFSSSTVTTRNGTGSAAGVVVASSGNVFGSISANGDAGATVDNAGRVRGSVNANSFATTQTSNSTSSLVTTPAAAGASVVVNSSANSTTNVPTGGALALVNRGGAVIESGVSIFGPGNVTVDDSGAIFGNIFATSSGNSNTSTNSSVTTATNPATPGAAVATSVFTTSSASSNTPVGGSVTGGYSGSVGAVAGSPLASAITVSQNGQAGSTATIGGVMFANFNASAGATGNTSSTTSTTTTTTQPFTSPATGASETVSASSTRNATTILAGNNSVTVTGALRNNGFGTGNLSASTQSGTTNVTVTSGTVEGNIQANAGFGTNSTSGSDSSSRSTVAATAAGPTPAPIAQSTAFSSFNETHQAAGASSVILTGTTIRNGVFVNGRGTGAGTVGASAVVAADSVVGGFLNVSTNGGADQRTDSSTTSTRTKPTAVTRTAHNATINTVPVASGDASASIAGRVNGATVFSPYGNAVAVLTGQITGGNQIFVGTSGTLFNTQTDRTFTGKDPTSLAAPFATTYAAVSSSTLQGGKASLTINSSAALQAAGTSAVDGGIFVRGLSGSTLSIGTGSRVLATNAGNISVGFDDGTNDTTTETRTFNGTGVQTGRTIVTASTLVGGPASFTNGGTVGSSAGFFGAPTNTTVASVGGSTVTNTGTIFGFLNATSLGANATTTTTTTNINDPVLTSAVATTTNAGVGGAVTASNSSIVSGRVTLAGATGTVANTGVLRGGITLGQQLDIGTVTTTTTATSSTRTATAPATRFAQAYTVNQNGLLISGINVTGATIADTSSGAAATATLRTSDITATVNLNSQSITTGNIIVQVVSPTDNTRLTNTTVLLNDAGFLGVGTSDLPSAAVGAGGAPLRFVNTPNYGVFAMIDPALGSSATGVFVPIVSVAGGSRITGATLVNKTGAGSFTILGSSYIAPSAANVLPTYTMDVGTFRISAGEVQLGVAGTDPVTGASIFGIRGNVENLGGTLLLGRRVTDGTTTVVQGTNVRIDGNLTQAAGGTLSVVATPTLVRNGGTAVGALPAQGILGFGGYGVGLTPFVAYDPTVATTLRSTPSSLLVNGNVALAGSIAVAAVPGTIYTAGRNYDLFTVSGTYTASGLTLAPTFTSPFVRFVLTPRMVGTSTVVSLDVARTSYATVTTTTNAAAAATALDGTIPGVVSRIAAIRNPNAVTDVQGYGNLQDLATVIAGLDTQLTAADATRAFVQLGSGSIYGSLAAIETTSVFGEPTDTLVNNDHAGVGLWFRPSGSFSRFAGSGVSGASAFKSDDFGGSLGVNIATGHGGEFGIGGGYGRINASDRDLPSKASAHTYLVGAYARQQIGSLNLSAQAVFGWSDWNTSRSLPLFSRTATAQFGSREFRFGARVGYDFALGGIEATPFAKIEARKYRFNGFDEQGAGGIGLAVAARDKTVFSPELGVRIGAKIGVVTPFAEGSYVFQGNLDAYRTVSYLGDRTTSFQLQGVNPKGYAKLGAGITADYHGVGFSLRGNYLTGNGNDTGQVLGGVSIRF